jgi:hypothetical protein
MTVSSYRRLRTQFTSRYRLRGALLAAGVEFEEVPVGESERHLFGWHGNQRKETATFIVRRDQIGHSSNDLGYHWNGECYEEIVSDFDSTYGNCTKIRQTVKREYAVATATEAAAVKGYCVTRIDQPSGEVQLVVTGRL